MTREGCGNDTPPCHPQPTARLSSSTESEALRIGDPEITDWIPVFTGMTHSLSSSTESEALRIGDPFGLDSRFRGNDGRGAGMTKRRYGNDGRDENDNG